MKETVSVLIVIAIKNIAIMACWTVLAIYFNRWWIALFALLFFSFVRKVSGSETEGET